MSKLNGIIVHYDVDSGFGIVKSDKAEEHSFNCSNALRSELKVGDRVVVTPAYDGHNDYVVRDINAQR